MNDCIFCQIATKQIPSHIIYEDQNYLAFLDNAPKSCGHTLVIPKDHYANLFQIPSGELEKLVSVVQEIAQKINAAFNPAGLQIVQNNGRAAGQSVHHIHFHIIPHYTKEPPMAKKDFKKIINQLQ